MSPSEYQELAEFIAGHFQTVNVRLDRVEARLDGVEERLGRVEVSLEENRHLLKLNAEAIADRSGSVLNR